VGEVERVEIEVAASVLETYVGEYELSNVSWRTKCTC
jgi:hypothetical protein